MNVKKRSYSRPVTLVSALLSVAAIGGCAALPSGSPEDLVRQRATARWEALISGDLDTAYGYLAPSYRAVRDLNQFRASISGAVQWKGINIVGVECKPEACSARVRIDYSAAGMAGLFNTHYDEQWVMEDGKWWLFQKP